MNLGSSGLYKNILLETKQWKEEIQDSFRDNEQLIQHEYEDRL